jgi:hypothetical protein
VGRGKRYQRGSSEQSAVRQGIEDFLEEGIPEIPRAVAIVRGYKNRTKDTVNLSDRDWRTIVSTWSEIRRNRS